MIKRNLIRCLFIVFYLISFNVNGQDEHSKLKYDLADSICECINISGKNDSLSDNFTNISDKCIEELLNSFKSQIESLDTNSISKENSFQRGYQKGKELSADVILLLIERCNLFFENMDKQRQESFIIKTSNNEELEIKIKQLTLLIEENPNFNDYISRGLNYLKLNNYKLAFQDFNNAVQLGPIFYSGYVLRGFAYEMLGEYENAEKDYMMANILNPTNKEIEMYLTFIRRKLRSN